MVLFLRQQERPTLDLSGEALRAATQTMVAGSDEHGGIERYVEAVKLKSAMFQQAHELGIGENRAGAVGLAIIPRGVAIRGAERNQFDQIIGAVCATADGSIEGDGIGDIGRQDARNRV